MQLIEQDKFVPKNEVFSPLEAFKFVLSLFDPHLKIQKTKLSFHGVAELPDSSFLSVGEYAPKDLPKRLFGD